VRRQSAHSAAQKFHTDRKLSQVTLMMLIQDLGIDDTHMQYAVGSNRARVPHVMHKDRYSFQDSWIAEQFQICDLVGPKGSVFLFNAGDGFHRQVPRPETTRRVLFGTVTTGWYWAEDERKESLAALDDIENKPPFVRKMLNKVTYSERATRRSAQRSLELQGLSGGWITSAGINIEVDASQLNDAPYIVLEGAANYEELGGEPGPLAAIVGPTGKPLSILPSSLKRLGSTYSVVIDARTAVSSTNGPVRINLTFDRYFVPGALGINSDTRELVLPEPTQRTLQVSVSQR
jgi:hypothetical protein